MTMLVARTRINQLGKLVGFGAELAHALPWQLAFAFVAGHLLMICGFVLSSGEPICLALRGGHPLRLVMEGSKVCF